MSGRARARFLSVLLGITLFWQSPLVDPGRAQEAEARDRPLAPLAERVQKFDDTVERLRSRLRIPGLSIAILHDQKVVLARGHGFADLEKEIPATENTLYRIASVSKPFAAILLLQLVEQGKLDLDAPMDDFAIHSWFPPDSGSWAHHPDRYRDRKITVRHVLTHTSQGAVPGESYQYSGNIFGDLTWVLEHITRTSYPVLLRERILDPLAMTSTLAGQLAPTSDTPRSRIAVTYRMDGRRPVPELPDGFGVPRGTTAEAVGLKRVFPLPEETQAAREKLLGDAATPLDSVTTAAGILTSVLDLALLDVALDRNQLVSAGSKKAMFSAHVNAAGQALPYGLGWFVEEEGGPKRVWHYGWNPPTTSALYLKVPERGWTLILLANTDQLSAGIAWSQLGVRASPFAAAFLDQLVETDRD